eukprot:EG_transcript_24871
MKLFYWTIYCGLFCFNSASDGALGWNNDCWEPSINGFQHPRALLYTTVGEYSAHYLEMVQIMVRTALFHLGPHTDVAIFAHPSWASLNQSTNASHFVLLDNEAFLDMRHAPVGAVPPSVSSQASANKLRIFQLLPSAQSYDVIIMLDVDIVVQANFLQLIGPICHDTMYVVSHQTPPELIRSWKYFQSRNASPAEFAYMKVHNPFIFNAGQFVFRPSLLMEKLFLDAYKSYKWDPLVSLYEQGHMNTVFLVGCRVRYTLTHL